MLEQKEPYYNLIAHMMGYENLHAERIQHFLKVYEFAKLIGTGEEISSPLMHILCVAAITHDIGIKPSEEKYGDCSGEHQEQEGSAAAREFLTPLGYSEELIERVCYLIGHHHTYHDIDGMDYQILIEADFLVNMLEGQMDAEACRSVYERIFRTKTGKRICRKMYPVRE